MFADRLAEKIKTKNCSVVVGLDTKIDYVPITLKSKAFSEFGNNFYGVAQAILKFNKELIDEIFEIVPAVKLQVAYYEMYGFEGFKVFCETARYAKEKGLIVIADAKRNDIGSTASAYSSAYIGKTQIDDNIEHSVVDADAVTVNPYLGIDGIKPFIDDCIKYDKGIFILVKTSNKSSGQFQDLVLGNGKSIFEIVAEHVDEWGKTTIGECGYSSIGAVVGATYPKQAEKLRQIMKNSFILVPGYGTQGGTAKDVANSFNEDGTGALVNASRSIMCAYKTDEMKERFDEKEYAKAARQEAIRMRDDINNALKNNY